MEGVHFINRPPSRGCVGIYRRLSRVGVYCTDVGRSTIISSTIVGELNSYCRVQGTRGVSHQGALKTLGTGT